MHSFETRKKISKSIKRQWNDGAYAQRPARPSFERVMQQRLIPAMEMLGFETQGTISVKKNDNSGGRTYVRPHFVNYEKQLAVFIEQKSERAAQRRRNLQSVLNDIGYRLVCAEKREATHNPDLLLERVYKQL